MSMSVAASMIGNRYAEPENTLQEFVRPAMYPIGFRPPLGIARPQLKLAKPEREEVWHWWARQGEVTTSTVTLQWFVALNLLYFAITLRIAKRLFPAESTVKLNTAMMRGNTPSSPTPPMRPQVCERDHWAVAGQGTLQDRTGHECDIGQDRSGRGREGREGRAGGNRRTGQKPPDSRKHPKMFIKNAPSAPVW
jgi:hypothetical protein